MPSHAYEMVRLKDDNARLQDDFFLDNVSSNSQDESSDELGINEALEGASCGCGTFLYVLGTYIFFCLEGGEILVLSIVGLMVKCEWELSTFWVSALQMNVIIGMALATLLSSRLGDKFGRKPICIVSSVGITVAGISCGFANTYWELFLLRMLVGIFMGLGYAPAVALSGEITPQKYRALALSGPTLAWSIGGSITSVISYFVIDPYGWRGFLIATAITFSPCILCFCLIGESPRFDVQRGNYKKAEKTVKQLYRLNCKPAENLKLKREAAVQEGEKMSQPFDPMSGSRNRSELILLCIMGACSFFVVHAIAYSAPRFLNEGYCSEGQATAEESCTFKKTVLFDLAIGSSSEPLGLALAIIMVDVIGRRKTFLTTVLLTLTVISGLYFCVNRTFLVAVSTFIRISVSILGWGPLLLSAEYFPTSVRSFSVGMVIFCERISAILAIFCIHYVYNFSPRLLLGLTQLCVVAVGICLVKLQRETMGVQLE